MWCVVNFCGEMVRLVMCFEGWYSEDTRDILAGVDRLPRNLIRGCRCASASSRRVASIVSDE